MHNLTPAQQQALTAASERSDGNLEPLPRNLRGFARNQLIRALLTRALVDKCYYPGHVEYHLTAEGFAQGRRNAQHL